MKVAITGSSGFIGTALAASLRADGHEVVRLVRRPPRDSGEVRWDPRAADGGLGDLSGLRGVTACVHLASAGVASKRWTSSYKAEVKASRVLGTRAFASALARLDPPPSVLVSASAIGWYGDTGGAEVDETAPKGSGFLADLVAAWEAAAEPARQAGIRVVHPRSGLVMSPRGGMLARLVPLARFGTCPRFGTGTQVMSWISLTDEIAALRFLLGDPGAAGPVNLTAPEPVSNSAFAAALNAVMRRPDLPWLRVPALVIRAGIGEAAVELLSSARVSSSRLAGLGFAFRYPSLPEALRAEFAAVTVMSL